MKKRVSEAELVAALSEWATHRGLVSYPETAGWDLVLVASDGWQIGVEAKVSCSWRVLFQVAKRMDTAHKPDRACVLVQKCDADFRALTARLGAEATDTRTHSLQRAFARLDPVVRRDSSPLRLWLPDVIPRGSGGIPSPSPLTPWRQAALRLCSRLRRSGSVMSLDFVELGLSKQTWLNRWVVATGWAKLGNRRFRVYEMVDPLPHDFPDIGFEAERDELAALDSIDG